MNRTPILTIAIPTYNMEEYLARNLESIAAAGCESLEVLILDNSSTDRSGHIADVYARKYPWLFTAIHKENRGYGSSINFAIENAKGQYLRIVDADDWVESSALAELVSQLKNQTADLLLMSYRMVDAKSGKEIMVCSAPEAWKAGENQQTFSEKVCPVPQLHGTVFRVDFLRQNGIKLLENAYYVDEQLMIWTYMSAASACKLELDVYRYSVGRETQSISPGSMGTHWKERERVIQSCLERQRILEMDKALKRTCLQQLAKNIGNHFTTLYIYVTPRKNGSKNAKEWKKFIQEQAPYLWASVKMKARVLSFLCVFHIPPTWYEMMKASPMIKKFISQN